MTSSQKVIKGFAIALATFIIILIASSIIGAINFFLYMFEPYNSREENVNLKTISYQDIKYLDIDLGSTNLEIKEGNEFKVEVSDDNVIRITNPKNTLKIRQNSVFFRKNFKGTVKVYVPANTLENAEVDIGAGKLSIENVSLNKLDLDHGAGYVLIKNSNFHKADIDGGAGKIEIENTSLNNLNFDAGVGNTTFKNSKITGNSDISVGVGNVSLELNGNIDDYTIKTDKGLGSLKVDGEEFEGTLGRGTNKLSIDGGVGNITLDFNRVEKSN